MGLGGMMKAGSRQARHALWNGMINKESCSHVLMIWSPYNLALYPVFQI